MVTSPARRSPRQFMPHVLGPGTSLLHWQATAAQLESLVEQLDFAGTGRGLAKFYWAEQWYGVVQAQAQAQAQAQTQAQAQPPSSPVPPGTILGMTGDSLVVATGDSPVQLSGLVTLAGKPLDPRTVGLKPGKRLPLWTPDQVCTLAQLEAQTHRYDAVWFERLRSPQPTTLPGADSEPGKGEIFVRAPLPLDDGLLLGLTALAEDGVLLLGTALMAYLLRLGGGEQPGTEAKASLELGLQLPALRQQLQQPGLAGLLASHVPCRLTLDLSQPLAAALALVQAEFEQLNLAQSYFQDLPLRQASAPQSDPQSAPQSALMVVPFPILLEVAPQTTEAPQALGRVLTIQLSDCGQDCTWFYNPAVLSDDSIERLQTQFVTWLQGLVQQPELPLARQPILDPAQRQQLLLDWNRTQADYDWNRCIHHQFEAQVQRGPERIALRCGDRSLTYRELNQRANQLARELRDRGVGPDDFVGLCAERSIAMVVGLMAILKAGGAYLPMDPSYPAERLALMVEDAAPKVILTQAHLLKHLPDNDAQLFCLNIDWDSITHHSSDNLKPLTRPEHLAYIIYTSGSTGRPKGVMIEHRALSNFAQAALVDYGITGQDRVLQFASISFDAAAEEIYPCLISGGELVLRTPEMMSSVPQFLRCCQDYGLTVLDLPTAYWHLMVAELDEGTLTLPPELRIIIIGGEAVNPERVGQWQRMLWRTGCSAQLINTYGPTEATVVATAYKMPLPSREPDATAPPSVTIGRPLRNVSTYILDGNQEPVPLGVPGELCIGGAGIARGYLRRPDKTAAQFIPDPFSDRPHARLYRTGDLVRYLANGEIDFLGRIDSQVKIRGFRIELGEIEALLSQQAQDVAVIVREDLPGQKRLVAYLVAKPDQPLNPTSLRADLKQRLPDYMVPAAFVLLDALPMTPSGKVDRRALPAPALLVPSAPDDPDYSLPETDTQRALAQLWEALLGLQPIGLDDHFFEIGGDSLLAVKLFVQIEKTFGQSLQLSLLFQAPTLRSLASILDGETEAIAATSAIPLKPSGSKPPLFFLNAGTYAKQFVPHLSAEQPLYNLNIFGITERLVTQLDKLTLAEIAQQFIQDLRQVQPQGPYYLAGYCDDSKLAIEMAQQLRASGDSPGRLILIDPMWDDPEGWRYHLQNLLKFGPDYLIAKGQERWKLLRNRLHLGQQRRQDKARDPASSPASNGEPARVLNGASLDQDVALYQRFLALCSTYQPRPYPGPVTVISSSELLDSPTPLLEQTLIQGFELCEVKGYHQSIFHAPQRANLVAQIERALGRLAASGSPGSSPHSPQPHPPQSVQPSNPAVVQAAQPRS